jgi:hypothetical protein
MIGRLGIDMNNNGGESELVTKKKSKFLMVNIRLREMKAVIDE